MIKFLQNLWYKVFPKKRVVVANCHLVPGMINPRLTAMMNASANQPFKLPFQVVAHVPFQVVTQEKTQNVGK